MRHLSVFHIYSPNTLAIISLALIVIIMSIASIHAATGSSNISYDSETYWTNAKSMPTARGEFGAVALNGMIYALGGVDYSSGVDRKDVVEVYDVAKNRWIKDAKPMPMPLDHFASAVYGGKIYVVGGFVERKQPTDKLFIYDPEKNDWQIGKSLPSPRGALEAEFIDGILYAIGGLNSSQAPVNTNYAFDPKTNTWTTKAPMLTPRQHFALAVLNGKLFVMGGRILGDGVPSEDIPGTLTNFDRVEMYDPQMDSWTSVQPMLTKRSGFAAASAGRNIFVFGGQGVTNVSDTVEKYDPVNDEWKFERSMSLARFALSAVPVDDRIYILGGQRISGSDLIPLSMNEIFHLDGSNKN